MILRFLCPAIELRSGSFFVCKCDRISFKRRKSCVPTRRERVRLTSDRVPLERFIRPGLAPVFRDLQKWSWFHDHFGKPAKTKSKIGVQACWRSGAPRAPLGDPRWCKNHQNIDFLVHPSVSKYDHAGSRNDLIRCQTTLWSGLAAPLSRQLPCSCAWGLQWPALSPSINAPFDASKCLPGQFGRPGLDWTLLGWPREAFRRVEWSISGRDQGGPLKAQSARTG